MFSDPNMAEWFSGLLLMVVSMGILVGISSLIAWTVMWVLGAEEDRTPGAKKTLDTATTPERKRTAA